MREIFFTIPGKPVGKGRPKFRRAGNHVQTYTPEKTAVYENLVKVSFLQAAPEGFKPFGKDTPLEMSITAHLAPPESVSKKKRAAMLAGEIYPTKIPDLDNIGKAIADGLHDICYENDSSIVKLSIEKRYSETPCAHVVVREIDGANSP